MWPLGAAPGSRKTTPRQAMTNVSWGKPSHEFFKCDLMGDTRARDNEQAGARLQKGIGMENEGEGSVIASRNGGPRACRGPDLHCRPQWNKAAHTYASTEELHASRQPRGDVD